MAPALKPRPPLREPPVPKMLRRRKGRTDEELAEDALAQAEALSYKHFVHAEEDKESRPIGYSN